MFYAFSFIMLEKHLLNLHKKIYFKGNIVSLIYFWETIIVMAFSRFKLRILDFSMHFNLLVLLGNLCVKRLSIAHLSISPLLITCFLPIIDWDPHSLLAYSIYRLPQLHNSMLIYSPKFKNLQEINKQSLSNSCFLQYFFSIEMSVWNLCKAQKFCQKLSHVFIICEQDYL